jgi:HEAT repeat protein
MSGELKKIVGLLKGADPELRCAAARILAELEPEEEGVVEALAKAAADDNGMVRGYAVDALRKLAKARHVDLLLPLLDGPARDKVLPLVKDLGGNPMAALKKGLGDRGKRLASAQSIASLGGRQAFEALLKETDDEDIEYVKNVTNLLRGVIDGLKDDDREKAYESARKALDGAKERVQKVAAIRCLGYLRAPEAADALAKLTALSEHPSIRSHAIHAIALLNFSGKKVPAAVVKTLLALLDDKDVPNIVEPALATLQKLPLPDTVDIDALLAHPAPAVRLLGVRLLAARGDRDSGRKLIELFEDRDADVRDAAASALRQEPKFAAMLAQFMEKEEKGGRADVFASILKGYQQGLPKEQVGKFLEKGLELFEKDGQPNWALEVAKSAAPEQYREALLEAGLKHKKARRLETAEKYLALVVREGGGTADARYELAVTRLRLAPKPEEASARNQSYPLAMLKDLAKGDARGLLKKLKGEPAMTGTEYLFAGLYFLDQEGLQDVGAELLKLAMKAGRSKEVSAAKAALKAWERGKG